MDQVNRAVIEAARSIAHYKIEHIVHLDPRDGTELWRGKGTKTHVTAPSATNLIAVHNHPDNGRSQPGFSRQDVALAIQSNCYELVVVDAGMLLRLRRPADGWRTLPWHVLQLANAGREDVWSEMMAAIRAMCPAHVFSERPLGPEGVDFLVGSRGVVVTAERALW